jgi:AMMECR1 domain-containing protein
VIVRHGRRSGLLLPALEGITTVEQQLEIARQKAGILPDQDVEIYRFEVKRYY